VEARSLVAGVKKGSYGEEVEQHTIFLKIIHIHNCFSLRKKGADQCTIRRERCID